MRIRWYPKLVSMGPCTTPTSSAKTTRSNSGTMEYLPNSPRFPPCRAEGQSELRAATSANLSGSSPISSRMAPILRSESPPFPLTRMWEASALRVRPRRNAHASPRAPRAGGEEGGKRREKTI